MTDTRRAHALGAPNPSGRLRAAMDAGTRPATDLIPVLIRRCAVEPDFQVREMLTWALTRQDRDRALPALVTELASALPQARSQALHTISKIADRRAWAAVSDELLRDADDDVARSAWRAAVALVPPGQETRLARTLATQLGRGGAGVRRSLSRALVALGEAAVEPIERGASDPEVAVREHAVATAYLREHPEEGVTAALDEARRLVALAGATNPRNGAD